jgi:hypothetical protein
MQIKIEVLKQLRRCPLVTAGISANVYRCPASVQLVDEVELLGFATDGHAAVQWSLGCEALADPNPETAWCGVPPHLFRIAADYEYYSNRVVWEAGRVSVVGSKGTVASFGRQIYSETPAGAVLTGPGPEHKVVFSGKVSNLLADIKLIPEQEIEASLKRILRLDNGVNVNAALVIACLKVLDKANVIEIHAAGSFEPVFITCASEKYYQAVIMPIRL